HIMEQPSSMGTLSHHQAKARDFLHRADRAISTHDPATHDPAEAAASLRRAASHATTALAVHQGWKHKSQRQLEIVLHANIVGETLSRSHLKTFRQAHTLSQQMPIAPAHGEPVKPRPRTAHGEPVEPRATDPTKSNHPVNPVHPCKTQLRRMRRRVASLITHAIRLIAGDPKPVRHHKLWLRQPDFPIAPDFTSIQDILSLPNYNEITRKFRLHSAPLAAQPDPHGHYAQGDAPRRCLCHAHLWAKPQNPHRITLSPLWRRALEKTFRIKLPNPLQLAC
ncbi:MAG: hypothetical protein OXE87_05060, partial [Chloroflexi bacterium]|nr:hypothetical protein [Chloroflexota bacterium]